MKNKLLFIIILLGLFFRIQNYTYPPLTWDEAALGYNTYSVSQTLKDEYGSLLPVVFKSFGDFKPGFYVYLALPFVKVFGLNELTIRLPSILLGSLIPLLLYLLIIQINSKFKSIALISAIVIAFNPYNIHFSRGAWESNILTFELLLGSFLFFKFINTSKNRFLLISSIVFGLSLYTYQGSKFISICLITLMFCLNFRKISLKKYLIFLLPLSVISLPIFFGLIYYQDSNRLKVVSLFSYPQNSSEVEQLKKETNNLDYLTFHNPGVFFSREFLTRYFNHFGSKFLIFEGDWQNPRHSAPYIGVILYPSLIFLIVGIFSGLTNNPTSKINLFFFVWLILAPIPAALTRDIIQAVRSLNFSIPLVYFISLGLFQTITLIKEQLLLKYKLLAYLFLTSISIAYLLSFLLYLDLYHNHLVKVNPTYYTYGYKEAVKYIVQNQTPTKTVYFSDFYGQPYIFYLFYSQYPPQNYQSQAKLISNSIDTGHIEKIDNIIFESPSYELLKGQKNIIAIFSYDDIARQGIDKLPEFSKAFIPLSPINGKSTFYAYQN